jgi:hypothetical protein
VLISKAIMRNSWVATPTGLCIPDLGSLYNGDKCGIPASCLCLLMPLSVVCWPADAANEFFFLAVLYLQAVFQRRLGNKSEKTSNFRRKKEASFG